LVLSTYFHFLCYFLVSSVPLFKPLCFPLSLFTNPLSVFHFTQGSEQTITTLHQMGTSGDSFLQVLFKNFDVLALYASCLLHLLAWMPLYDVDSHKRFKLFFFFLCMLKLNHFDLRVVFLLFVQALGHSGLHFVSMAFAFWMWLLE